MLTKNSNPPDGWKAFVVAVCASLIQATTFGISNSFPTFIGQLMADEDLQHPSSSILSWVQSIALGLSAVLAVPAGIMVDRFGPRPVNFISGLGLLASLLLASLAANSGPALIGLYSLPMGLAMGFMMSTGATSTSSWFEKRAALGMGICFTGGGTGSLSIPRIAGALAAKYSWRTSFLILSALTVISFISTIFVRIRTTDEDSVDEVEDGVKIVAAEREGTTELQAVSSGNAERSALHSPTAPPAEVIAITASSDSAIFNYHTDKATVKQLIFECVLTRNFLGLFFGYGFFSIGFYSFLYIAVPYPLSMGTGPYSSAASISVDGASNVFVPFGIMQTLGGIANGAIATKSDPRLVFIAAMGLLCVTSAFYSLCRELWEFLLVCAILGYGISGFFATFGTMIAQRFHGPNLPLIMSLAFAGAALGGFFGSPLATEITNAEGGNYAYATVLMSLSFFIAGVLGMFVITDVEDADARLMQPVTALPSAVASSGQRTPKDKQPLLQPSSAVQDVSPLDSRNHLISPTERYAPTTGAEELHSPADRHASKAKAVAVPPLTIVSGTSQISGDAVHAIASPDLMSGSPSQVLSPKHVHDEANTTPLFPKPPTTPGLVEQPQAVPEPAPII